MDYLVGIGLACALCFSALGSAFGTGIASQGAIGGWKKCYMQSKKAPFTMVAFSGAPLTQTIYGYLLSTFISNSAASGAVSRTPMLGLAVGFFAGIAIGFSAFFQGKAAAAACDSLAETEKGTANYFIVVGIIETVALFTLILGMLLLQ
ncbi:MAG TPA: V-type ATP synthase subunit K [Spirochaetaceae bacterium]|nr:V-type ATP synthase subunit K [Spirochaetaceae bacterium]